MIQIRKEAIMILSKTYVMLFFKKLLKKNKEGIQHGLSACL